MVTDSFRHYLQSLGLHSSTIDDIIHHVSTYIVRINADTIQFPDTSTYYSEAYTETMMKRERDLGKTEGRSEPEKHIAEIVCSECGVNLSKTEKE